MRILFVCTGNTCRSIMAELTLKEKLNQKFGKDWYRRFYVDSAGLMADNISTVSENVIKVLKEFYNKEFDSNRKCKLFDDKMLNEYDIILTVTATHKKTILKKIGESVKNVFTISEFVDDVGDINDPFMCGLDVYKSTFDRISFLLDKLVGKLSVLEVSMGNVFEINHPIIKHKLSMIRDKHTSVHKFRGLCSDISMFLCYEALKECKVLDISVETPICNASGVKILEDRITFVAVLRAGLGMLEGALKIIPEAKVGHIGLYRDEVTFKAVEYFSKIPKNISDTDVILLDPMIATGGSIIDSIRILKEAGVKNIKVLSVIASPQGLDKITSEFNDVYIYVAAIDSGLNEKGYIVPGLGDAGDRIFGTQ